MLQSRDVNRTFIEEAAKRQAKAFNLALKPTVDRMRNDAGFQKPSTGGITCKVNKGYLTSRAGPENQPRQQTIEESLRMISEQSESVDPDLTERTSVNTVQKSRVKRYQTTDKKRPQEIASLPLRRQSSRADLSRPRDVSMHDETRRLENPETALQRKRSITMPIPAVDKKPRKPLKRLTLEDSPIQLGSSTLSDYTKIACWARAPTVRFISASTTLQG